MVGFFLVRHIVPAVLRHALIGAREEGGAECGQGTEGKTGMVESVHATSSCDVQLVFPLHCDETS